MNVRHLRKIRLTVSLIFFLALSTVFLDLGNNISPSMQGYILYLQFVPSLIKLTLGGAALSLGFLIILTLTILFGRVYCSSICPLGTFQDIINRISYRFIKKKKKHSRFNKEHRILRYSILAITVITFLSGSVFLLNILDPYSNFGKITVNIFRPILINANNLISSTLESMDLYWLYPQEIRYTGLLTWGFPLLFFIIVGYLAFFSGRLYCNTICPVGTLLGLLSKYSLFKIKIDEKNCKSCGVCEKVCKANCIDSRGTKTIDISRCINCYNCMDVCPSDGIKFNPKRVESTVPLNESKRKFVTGILVYLAGTTGLSFAQNKIIPKKKSKIPNLKKYPVTPPGSVSIERFTDLCTACHLCVKACPTQVLQPSFLEYGFTNMLQPRMDYHTSFCNFECTVCSEICPTGAISLILLNEKKTKQLGKVKFIEKNCIVHTENTECGACSEHCPTKAVTMVPHNKLFSPKTNEEICIGCGACEFACPVKPYKAIYVEGNPVHLTAKKPEIKKLEEKVDYNEDFPF